MKPGPSSRFTAAVKKTPWAIGLIFITGLLLRLFQLGTDNFWVDEIGVALAAQEASFQGMLRVAHSHVMAMPLDYCVAWLMGRFGSGEAWLRLPAALWGAATVPAAYALFRRLAGSGVAWMAALLLAVSPIHIQYSQELRFYAPLVFFYVLSTGLLLRAIQESHWKNWLRFTLATGLGMFFHIYVPLAVLNGTAWLWITHGRDPAYTPQRKYFLRSLAMLLLASLAAIVFFGGVLNTVRVPLLLKYESLLSVLGVGLGWLPFYANLGGWAWLFGVLCCALAVVGVLTEAARDKTGPRSILFASLMVQALIVIAMNALKNYFLAPRQFLILLPFLLFYTALGIRVLAEVRILTGRSGNGLTGDRLRAALIVLLLAASLPALANYYSGDKGRIEEVSRRLQHARRPGEAILFIPDFELNTFEYYWRRWGFSSDLAEAALPVSWEMLSLVGQPLEETLLVTYADLLPEQEAQLNALSFQKTYAPVSPSEYSFAIWERAP